MNFKKLPKSNEVEEINLGNMKAQIVEVTDENREHVLEAVARTYMGDKCKFCLQTFTLEEVRKSVICFWEGGRIAHKECWNKNGGAS